jgi:hypothetical protein
MSNRKYPEYLIYKDKTLKLEQWADILGLTLGALKARLRSWDLDKALTTPRRTYISIGQKFGELTVLRREQEKTKSGYHKWLCKCSCGKERVVSTQYLKTKYSKSCGCLAKKRGQKYLHQGKLLTISELSELSNIQQHTIYQRLKKGMPVDEAVSVEKLQNKKQISYGGKTQSIRQWAKEIGLSREGLRQRLKKGWTLEKALTMPRTDIKY